MKELTKAQWKLLAEIVCIIDDENEQYRNDGDMIAIGDQIQAGLATHNIRFHPVLDKRCPWPIRHR